jgi:hypothetical protein
MEVWFWVGLAGVGVVGVWRTFARRDRARRLMLECRRAGLEYSPIDPFPDTAWLPFRWAIDGKWLRAEHVVWHRAEGEQVRAFDLLVEERRDDDAPKTVHRYSCAALTMPFGCPRIEIVPRGAVAHLASLVADDVELELEAFNRRFRVIAEDRRAAVAFCDQRMMRALLQLPGEVGVAVHEDRLLLHADALDPARVLLLFEAARAIGRAVPPVVADLYPPRPTVGPYEARWLQGRWSPAPIGDDVVASDGGDGAPA